MRNLADLFFYLLTLYGTQLFFTLETLSRNVALCVRYPAAAQVPPVHVAVNIWRYLTRESTTKSDEELSKFVPLLFLCSFVPLLLICSTPPLLLTQATVLRRPNTCQFCPAPASFWHFK